MSKQRPSCVILPYSVFFFYSLSVFFFCLFPECIVRSSAHSFATTSLIRLHYCKSIIKILVRLLALSSARVKTGDKRHGRS